MNDIISKEDLKYYQYVLQQAVTNDEHINFHPDHSAILLQIVNNYLKETK